MNLNKNVKVILIEAGAGSAGTTLTSDAVDTQGFEGCMFVGSIATVDAGNFAKVQQSSDDGSSDTYADLEGTKNVPGDDGDSFLIDVYKPRERYLKLLIVRGGADSITGDVYAILYGAHDKPTGHGATIDAETHASPAEGTA
jgi:hypothetical protein